MVYWNVFDPQFIQLAWFSFVLACGCLFPPCWWSFFKTKTLKTNFILFHFEIVLACSCGSLGTIYSTNTSRPNGLKCNACSCDILCFCWRQSYNGMFCWRPWHNTCNKMKCISKCSFSCHLYCLHCDCECIQWFKFFLMLNILY